MSSPDTTTATFFAEDQLWAGLQFHVTDEAGFAEEQGTAGDRVHFHSNVWWRELRYGFCQPCFPFRAVDCRNARPQALRSIAGFTHLAAPGSLSNGVYRTIVNDDVKRYSLRQFRSGRQRTKIRAGLTSVEVRPVTQLEDLIVDGYGVYASWRERTGWGADKRDRAVYEDWITRAFHRPRRIVLGAYQNDKLVAFMLPAAVCHVASLSFIASHTDALEAHPNDALYHAFLCIARQTLGIEIANFGTTSSKPTLDEFKLRYGKVKEFPSYTWINPAIRLVFKRQIARRYPWLGQKPVPGTWTS